MGEAELRKLLADAQDALARGAKYNDINEYIRSVTGGQINGMAHLTVTIDPEAEADRRLAESVDNKSPVSDFLRTMAEGATLGFADEIVGLFGGDAEASRARMDRIRTRNPGATMAGEIAGAIAVPGLGAARAFKALRGGGGILRTGGAGAIVGTGEGAIMGAGQSEGDRLGGAARGGAAGAFTGGLLSGGGSVLSRLASPLRPNRSIANEALRDIVDATGIERRNVPARVRALPEGSVVADVSPVTQAVTPRAVRQAPGLLAAGGPARRVIERANPQAFRAVRRAVWEPLEQATEAITDKPTLNLLRSNVTIRDAARGVVNRDVDSVSKLSFRQLQTIREKLRRVRDGRSTLPDAREQAAQALGALDNALDVSVPGFREARRRYAQLLTQQRDWQRLATAVERAVPQIRLDLPSRIEGLGATARNLLVEQGRRRQQIMEMIGEVLLENPEDGAEIIERMILDGTIAQMFSVSRSAARTGATTQAGRAFGGGLLSPGSSREER